MTSVLRDTGAWSGLPTQLKLLRPTTTFHRQLKRFCCNVPVDTGKQTDGCYPRESFREGLWNHRRTFVCLSVCYHDN